MLNRKHLQQAHEFFERYGGKAVVLGRFVPIVRTFITVMAGVGRMEPRRYLTYSLIGGVAWAAGVTGMVYEPSYDEVTRQLQAHLNRVLNAAALTYVAATLQAILTLLYYVMIFTSGNRR